ARAESNPEANQVARKLASARVPGSATKPPFPPVPMMTPDIPELPFELDAGVKVFSLKAAPLKRKIAPFKTIDVWGYNGCCPGPTIQITRGDRVRVVFENALPESTSLHWHGLEVPIEQDGVPWISQKPVPPGGTFVYEFTVHQAARVGRASGKLRSEHGRHGVQLADIQWPFRPCNNAADCPAR